MEREQFEQGLVLLRSVYARPELADSPPDGLSHYAVCLARVQKKYKEAIALCNQALSEQFYDGTHIANLGRVHLASGDRKQAVATLEEGLKRFPRDPALIAFRDSIGYRVSPVIPFLARKNPLNEVLGRIKRDPQRWKVFMTTLAALVTLVALAGAVALFFSILE